jgi:hypothetical protein
VTFSILQEKRRFPWSASTCPGIFTRQVAREGFTSLAPEQKGLLPFIECKVDPEYMEFIRRAHGAHAHGQDEF